MASIPVGTYHYNPATPGQPAVTFNMNGETVDFIPMMPSHTAGDTIVRFRKANVIYIEDFYRNFGYPFADQSNGGSIKGMLEAVDLIRKIAGPDTTLIPGHGTLLKKDDLLAYRAMLVDILAKVKTLRDQGKSLKEVLAANLTAPYDKTTQGDTQSSKDRFITEVYGRKAGDAEAPLSLEPLDLHVVGVDAAEIGCNADQHDQCTFGHVATVDELPADQRAGQIDTLKGARTHRVDAPEQRQLARDIVALGHRDDRHRGTKRRQAPRAPAAAGNSDDGLRGTALGKSDGRFAHGL